MATTFFYPDCLVREARYKFYRRFLVPKLYDYAKRWEWEKIVQRCKSRPRVAAREARFHHQYAPNQTALHLTLEPCFLLKGGVDKSDDLDCPENMAEHTRRNLIEQRHRAAAALLEANPDATMVPCVLGTLPLHMVSLDPFASMDDLIMLAEACPKSAVAQDLTGKAPLHYCCMNNRANDHMVKVLLSIGPHAATLTDRLGRTALHYCCMAGPNSMEDARRRNRGGGGLMEKFEGLIEEQNNNGNAATCTQAVLKRLLDTNPVATSIVDKDGLAPIHHLCRFIQAFGGLDCVKVELLLALHLLVETNPGMSFQPDGHGCTPVVVLRKLHEASDFNEQYELLEKMLKLLV